jgi:uncharacterized membrane protein YhaH (DUF805 family)
VTQDEPPREPQVPSTPPPPPPPAPQGAPPPPPPSGGSYGGAAGPTAPPGNPLVGYYKRVVFERYAKFDGRANRPEFWWFVLANLIIQVVFNILSQAADFFLILGLIYGLAVLVPSIAVAVRRLHDLDKSGWFLLLWLIPCVGWIILIVWYATEGTRGPNRFGAYAT